MRTAEALAHIEANRTKILEEAKIYAKNYSCSLEEAMKDVSDEYVQGLHEGEEHSRY